MSATAPPKINPVSLPENTGKQRGCENSPAAMPPGEKDHLYASART
jgi:hypothetical protein